MSIVCRFCLDDTDAKENPLIQPCKCKGSARYVHTDCMRIWRRKTTVPKHVTHCQMCLTKYALPMIFPLEIIPEGDINILNILLSNPLLLWAHSQIVWYIINASFLVSYDQLFDNSSLIIHENAMQTITQMTNVAMVHGITIVYCKFYLPYIQNVGDKQRYFRYWIVLQDETIHRPIHVLYLTGALYMLSLYFNSVFFFLYILSLQHCMFTHKKILQRMNNDSI